jgi:phosphohistidine phosphatase
VDLYLLRHAVAFGRDPSRWPDDSRRPLTPRGEEEFRAVAHELGRIEPRVDMVLSSPFARAWRTAEILADLASWPYPTPMTELEPDVPPHEATQALEPYEDLDAIALVGHRPQIHELAAYLLTGKQDGVEVSIQKGGAVCLRVDGALRPGSASLRWSMPLKLLKPEDA